MKAENIKYPDSLWSEIFDSSFSNQEVPMPDDADQVLSNLLERANLPERSREILEQHFTDGTSLSKLSEEIGVTPGRLRQIIRQSSRKIREQTHLKLNNITLQYGLAVNKLIEQGEADICAVCEKVIRNGQEAIIVPSYEYGFAGPKPAIKLCCCLQCAQKSINEDAEIRERRIALIKELLQREEGELFALKTYDAVSIPFDEAKKQMDLSEVKVLSKSRGGFYDDPMQPRFVNAVKL